VNVRLKAMASLKPALRKRLRGLRVRIDAADGDSVLLRGVPADPLVFNKPCTNLLITRPGPGLPFLVCVDEDLAYQGGDAGVARAFAMAVRRQGWRVILPGRKQQDLERTLDSALQMLGQEAAGREARAHAAVLPAWASDLTELTRAGKGPFTTGRTEEIEHISACLLRREACLPLVAGPSGVGKTNLLHAVTRSLLRLRPAWRVLRVDLGTFMAGMLLESERENALVALLRDAAGMPGVVLALEQLEWAFAGAPHGSALLKAALERGVKVVGTTSLPGRDRILAEPVVAWIECIDLGEPPPETAVQILHELRETLAAHHRVEIDPALIPQVVDRSLSLAGCLPAKAIALLDGAAAQAAVTGGRSVTLFDVYLVASRARQGERAAGG
jgi:ATP-dependent Clp protease ATP-binding subunit ClpA